MTSIAEAGVSGPVAPDPAVRARLVGYFQAEARELCEALVRDLDSASVPAPADLARAVSHARAIRGAAAVTDLATISRVAGHIERVLKALHGRRLAWTATLSSQVKAASSQLLDFIAAAANWSDHHERAADAAAAELARYDVAGKRGHDNLIVPIAKLFHSDSGPHIVFMPATPQTQFEQQLRALAQRGAPGGGMQTPPAGQGQSKRTPTSPRGHELHALLGLSVSRMNATFKGGDSEPVPIETLLYSGSAALDRAREVARTIRARGAENARELLPELIDLLDLATPR